MNLTRFYGVFAPNSKYRKAVTGYDKSGVEESSATTINPNQRYRMSWAQRLKRVFNIDITIFQHCQGQVRVVACIEDKVVIERILSHINTKHENQKAHSNIFTIRCPPQLVSLITANRTGELF